MQLKIRKIYSNFEIAEVNYNCCYNFNGFTIRVMGGKLLLTYKGRVKYGDILINCS